MMEKAQKKYNRAIQVGQWQRSQKHFREAIEYVHSGKLGNVRMVKTWAFQGWMKPSPKTPATAVPNGIDYDLSLIHILIFSKRISLRFYPIPIDLHHKVPPIAS